LFGILNLGHCDLPFDFAQGGGELVEPFGICYLLIARMKLHHLLQKCSFFLIKLAVFWPAAALI